MYQLDSFCLHSTPSTTNKNHFGVTQKSLNLQKTESDLRVDPKYSSFSFPSIK